jgi:hypothetical protein
MTFRWHIVGPISLPIVAVALFAVVWTVIPVDRAPVKPADVTVTQPAPPPASDVEVRMCDEQVPILLHTRDPVEYQRAEFLVRHFNCGIAKRAFP